MSDEKKEEKPKKVSLYSMGRGRRKKKADDQKSGNKKISGGLLRIQSDLTDLELPYNSKLTIPDKSSLRTFQVEITPDKGCWKGATYTFKFDIPDEYPHKPPKVVCLEKIYHPNIDTQGKICLNLLKEDWRPILAIQDVIHGLIFLLLEPNPADPLNHSAAEVMRNNPSRFQSNVRQSLQGGYVDGVQYPRMKLKSF